MSRYQSERYKEWRNDVYSRDQHKCQACGKRGRLNAHHLNGWDWAVSQRFNISNGITLCSGRMGCHAKFHNLYGRGKNNTEQFSQFLSIHYDKSLPDLEE